VNLLPESERSYNTVTMMVIPEEAEMLVLAQELGSLSMSLRNENDLDDGVARQGKTTIATLLNGERLSLIEKERRERITVIRGKASSTGEEP
jgi:pilus assembly protein CpaB